MMKHRFPSRRGSAPPRAAVLAAAAALLLSAALFQAAPVSGARQAAAGPSAGQGANQSAGQAAGRDAAPPPPDAMTTAQTEAPPPDDALSLSGEPAGCQPPSTQQWLLIGAGTVVLFVICFLLLVRVVQRRFINQDWSATLGRHAGISLTLLLGSAGMALLAYLITGCLHRQFWLWLLFPLALWSIHGFYILVVVRSRES